MARDAVAGTRPGGTRLPDRLPGSRPRHRFGLEAVDRGARRRDGADAPGVAPAISPSLSDLPGRLAGVTDWSPPCLQSLMPPVDHLSHHKHLQAGLFQNGLATFFLSPQPCEPRHVLRGAWWGDSANNLHVIISR